MKYDNKSVSLVIFDMDGTVLDTLRDLAICTNYALEKCGYNTVNAETVKKHTGKGVRFMTRNCMPDGATDEEFIKLFSVFEPYYKEHLNDNTAPYRGIVDSIKALRKNGYKTAVLSNKLHPAVEKLCGLHFDGLFDCILGSRGDIAPKPSPDGIYRILGDLGVGADQAVFVGDSETDAEAGFNAGLEVVGVDWGFRERKVLEGMGVKTIVSSPEELLKLFV